MTEHEFRRRVWFSWRLFSVVWIVLVAGFASAQTGTPTSKLTFNQEAPDLVTAQAYVYRIYADGGASSTLAGVTCSGAASPFVCSAPFPAFTPGAHTLVLSASNAAGEGPMSAVFGFTFVVLPAAPQGIRIQ